MPNLNPKSTKEHWKSEYTPGVYTAPTGGQTITVTHQAQVNALVAKGWTRTSD